MTYADDYAKRLQQIQAARVAGSLAPQPASKSELANLILQRARSDFSVTGPSSMPKQDKSMGSKVKSFALGVLDKLARPGYAFNEAAQQAFNEGDSLGDVLHGAKEGFVGHKKTSFVDVLQKQYEDDIPDSDEYKQILKDYGQNEADWFKESQKRLVQVDPKAIVGGTIVDLTLDPINAIGLGPLKALKGLTSVDKALEGAELGSREIATEAVPEVVQEVTKGAELPPTEPPKAHQFAQELQQSLSNADQTAVEIPRVTGKFASNRRPPSKKFDATSINSESGLPNIGQPVKAMFGEEAKQFTEQLRAQPKYASLSNVHNGDLKPQDYEKLQKARNITETAQVMDQVAKGNPAANELVSAKTLEPLSPVARRLTDNAVNSTVREIMESVADPAKAKALGKQPRHPVYNAPSQNNLSSKLTNAARQAFTADTGQRVTKAASPKFVPQIFDHYLNMLKNAEESLVMRGRDELNDAFYPRGGIKPDSPYLRLSDVLEALPRGIAQKAILGPSVTDKVLPSTLLKAITGNKAALGKIAGNRELLDAIQNTDWTPLMVKEYAARTIDATNAMEDTTRSVAGFIADKMADTSSDVSKAKVVDDTVKAGKAEFSKQMPEAKASLVDMLDGLRKSASNPTPNIVDDIIQRGKQKLAASVTGDPKIGQAERIKTAEGTVEDIIKEPARNAGVNPVLATGAADGIFSTVLSWVKPNAGYKDLRPILLKNISTRKSSAAVRAHEIIKIFQQVPEAEHMDMWNEVRGFLPPTANHAAPVAALQKMLGNMLGESGLASKFAGNTSIARSGTNVQHLNKHLKIVGIKDFEFHGKVPDPLKPGKTVDVPESEILNGWKNYQPKNSQDLRVFTHNLTQAVENAMVEYSVWSNMGALWGSRSQGQNTIPVSGMHPAVDGLHFPKDLAPQMGKVAQGIDEMFESVSSSKLMRAYDTALRTWKTGVTIYAPSHHIRNMVGDVFMSWLDGVSNPMYYTKAAQILKANHHRYSDMKVGKNPLADILGENVEPTLLKQITGQAQERLPKGTRVIVNGRAGGKKYPITIDQVYQMGYRHGLFPHSAQIEDLPGTETLMESLANRFHPGKAGVFQPAKGKVAHGVRQLSESREHYARIAHYLHALENTKATDLQDLFYKAAERVRKYHPDGLDLTVTEKKVMRRLFPFYSWTRKAIPLVLEGMVMNPGKILAYPKIMSSMQESQGIESSVSDPWPDDQLFPDWLASTTIGPTIPWDSSFARAIARSDDEVGYGLINPGNPATDILEDYGNDPVKGVGNSITPFLKIPAELAFGTNFQSGAPISDKTEYIDKNIPLLSTISRLTNGAVGTGLVEGGDLKGKETSATNLPALINYLTGAGMLDTGRYIKGGEYDLRERLRQEKANGSK